MIELLKDFLCLSIFISSFTLGLRIISGKGMVLYPIRKWFFSFGEEKQELIAQDIQDKKAEIRKIQTKSFTLISSKIVKEIEKEIEVLEWDSFVVDAWHKPIITCAPCMCSFHGILITAYFYSLVGISILYVAPLSIFFSVLINSFLWNNYKL